MVYLITYDLIQPGQNYDALIAEIKGLSGIWAYPCKSAWLVDTTLTASQIATRLYMP